MSRFINNKLKRIELDGGDWIDVLEKIQYEFYREVLKLTEFGKGDNTAAFMPVLEEVIKAWNFADEQGAPVECTKENIKKLDALTILELANVILPMYTPEKKS